MTEHTAPNATDEPTADRSKTAVVLLSGGMDSATTAYEAKSRGYDLYLLHTSYGQRTEDREYECARRLADDLDALDFLRVETGHLAAIGASSLTDEGMEV
ncbi:7-cyano-7-deazaguanine synthase, partial [Halobium palmae]